MDLCIPIVRCLRLNFLFAVWRVAAVNGYELSDTWNGTRGTDSASLSVPGAKCVYTVHHLNSHDYVWRCRGYNFLTVPANITSSSSEPMNLMLADAGIKVLLEDSLTPYAGILRDLYLNNVPEFHTFESGIFRHTTKLRTIYINRAPKLTHIHNEVFNVHLPRLKIIRILRTALLSLPYLGNLVTDNILQMVDLENNHIGRIRTASIKIKSEELILNYNKITSVDSMAFNGSHIAKLSMKGNTALTTVHTDAFVGLASIRELDLSETSITTLPTRGLQDLDVLRIENTKTLNKFPSVYNFNSITKAYLTYPYHCCAFKFPAKHDPVQHRKYEELVMKLEKDCPLKEHSHRSRNGWSYQHNYVSGTVDDIGTFHTTVITPSTQMSILCGNVSTAFKNVICYPKPDAFNPCEDIMGYWGLRIAVWFVAILAIFGNLAVLTVLVSPKVVMTVPKFLMCNLALADFFMGIYLILIAGTDARSIGEYFNYAIDWQSGLGCQVAGFLTVFSTELSIFTLTIITSERWYTITYAIHLNRRLKLKTSARIMAAGWAYACVMAVLPLTGISGYDKTSICLPLENRDTNDLLYLVTLLVFNGFAFSVIVVCYGCMYTSIRNGREELAPMTRSDTTVARRMALLVFTDFVCWAPIAFFGIAALVGRPIIDVTQTKVLLVFVYPLNSCANPYLYALLTHQYRRDLFKLLARHGMCVERAARYKDVTGVSPTAERTKHRDTQGELATSGLKPGPVTATTVTITSEISAHNNYSAAAGRTTNDSRVAVEEFHMVRKVRADVAHCDAGTGTGTGDNSG